MRKQVLCLIVAMLAGCRLLGATGDVDPSFNAGITNAASLMALQPDGKILVGARFTGSGPFSRGVVRLNSDGSIDSTFLATLTNSPVACVSALPDGGVMVAGSLRVRGIALPVGALRLKADGSVDPSFNPSFQITNTAALPVLTSLLVQPDGRILIGGAFTTIYRKTHHYLARLNADGSLDSNFNPDLNNGISGMTLQADGKIVILGSFTSVDGVAKTNLARINPDGTLDSAFTAPPGAYTGALAIQSDGKLLVGQFSTKVSIFTHTHCVRLNLDGSFDPTFVPNWPELPGAQFGSAIGYVGYNIALQANGKILIGGPFTNIGGTSLTNLARLNLDGSVDLSFVPSVVAAGGPIIQQGDGQIITPGFGGTNGAGKEALFRIENDPPKQSLTVPSSDRIRWMRGGALPEAVAVTFGLSIDQGVSWQFLGVGSRIAGGWELADLNLPSAGLVRARAYTYSSTESLSLVDVINNFPPQDPIITVSGDSVGIIDDSLLAMSADGTDFGLTPLGGSSTHAFGIQNLGAAPLNLTNLPAVQISGPQKDEFIVAVQPPPVVAGDGGIGQFQITFSPKATGLRTAHVSVFNGSTESPFEFSIQGIGEGAGNPVPGFDPQVALISAIGVQTDGKIMIGGTFTNIGALPIKYFARLNGDGSLDASFAPKPNADVKTVLMLPDGKMIVGGSFTNIGGASRRHLARLRMDGSVDPEFTVDIDPIPKAIAIHTDGTLYVAGDTFANGNATSHILRIRTDLSIDSSYTIIIANSIACIAVLPNGQILAGGNLITVGGPSRANLVRFLTNGAPDLSFTFNGGLVLSLAVQPDGKIIYANGIVGRLNTDGSPDTNLVALVNGLVDFVAPQTDGKIVAAGRFTSVNGVTNKYICRLNSDGSLDSRFNPNLDENLFFSTILPYNTSAAAIEADGSILIVGSFTSVGGLPRGHFARLQNDAATQSLTFPDASRVRWVRGGACPEVRDVTFEASYDSGESWIDLGSGSRVDGGWELAGLSLPLFGQVRARGRVTGGNDNGSSSLIETDANPYLILSFNGTPGIAYKVQAADNLVEPINWVDLDGEDVPDSSGSFTHSDINPGSTRFYRAVPVNP